jgi:2-(1,2-epoxy-1,2-dihydrophenyl)acetyl-CoA isomerase
MAYNFILVDITESVMKITLNRPEVLNSFHLEMAQELHQALDQARAEKSVRAVLLTGAGRGFCAGQDLSAVPMEGAGKLDLGIIVRQTYNPVIQAIRKLDIPVICAVNGVAAGAGANLAIACDIVIAAEGGSFIQSFTKIGLIPDTAGTFFLPRAIGLPMATALMMTGEKITATRAAELGMIYRVVPNDQLAAESMKLATTLAQMPTKGLALTKRALNASMINDLDAQLDTEEQLQREAGRTHDFDEGVAAFKEKRAPVFKGE